MSETLAAVLIARMLPGETPALIESSHLTLQLARQLMGDNDTNTQNMDVNGGSFTLPDLPFMTDSRYSFVDRSVSCNLTRGKIDKKLSLAPFTF